MPILPDIDDAITLSGILLNARLRLAGMSDTEFLQLFGPAGPRQGHPEEDGLIFTAATCEQVYRHLRDNGICCVRVSIDIPGLMNYSVVIGVTWEGVKRGIDKAEKAARRASYGLKQPVACAVLDPVGAH